MEHYINQLIGDIHKVTLNLRSSQQLGEESGADPGNELEPDDITDVEQYFEGEIQPISRITSIAAELLPPPEKLTEQQLSMLADELENLLLNFHFVLEFPENYPAHLRYPFIRDFWNEEEVALSFGRNHIEFCDYDEEKCPFPGYCTMCRDIDKQLNRDDEIGNEPPFN